MEAEGALTGWKLLMLTRTSGAGGEGGGDDGTPGLGLLTRSRSRSTTQSDTTTSATPQAETVKMTVHDPLRVGQSRPQRLARGRGRLMRGAEGEVRG